MASFVHQSPVDWHLGGVKEKRRIGGSVLRAMPGDRLDIAGVRDNGGVFLQGFKQCHGYLLSFKLGDLNAAMQHSTRFALVDREMQIRGYYDTSESDSIKRVIADVYALARENN